MCVMTEMMIDWIFRWWLKKPLSILLCCTYNTIWTVLSIHSWCQVNLRRTPKKNQQQQRIKSIIIIQLACRCCVRAWLPRQSVSVKQRLIIILHRISDAIFSFARYSCTIFCFQFARQSTVCFFFVMSMHLANRFHFFFLSHEAHKFTALTNKFQTIQMMTHLFASIWLYFLRLALLVSSSMSTWFEAEVGTINDEKKWEWSASEPLFPSVLPYALLR